MVQAGGLEPPTSGSTDQRSNQLSYACTRDRLRSMLDPSGRNLGVARSFGKRPSSALILALKKRKPGHFCPGIASTIPIKRLKRGLKPPC
jgi:hypothetical protein